MAARRDPAVAYTTPFTISGVPSSLYSGRLPMLSVLNRQATSSLLKLDALIWSSGRYLVSFDVRRVRGPLGILLMPFTRPAARLAGGGARLSRGAQSYPDESGEG